MWSFLQTSLQTLISRLSYLHQYDMFIFTKLFFIFWFLYITFIVLNTGSNSEMFPWYVPDNVLQRRLWSDVCVLLVWSGRSPVGHFKDLITWIRCDNSCFYLLHSPAADEWGLNMEHLLIYFPLNFYLCLFNHEFKLSGKTSDFTGFNCSLKQCTIFSTIAIFARDKQSP